MTLLNIHLAARLRAPEWGQIMLEEWLMGQRGDVLRPKDRTQRIASINRAKMSIERNLQTTFDWWLLIFVLF